jgi:phage terminase large subunit-like protein
MVERPDKSRGWNLNYFWGDEIAAWHDPITTWDNLMLALRVDPPSGRPLAMVTTTPRPNAIMRMLVQDEKYKDKVTVTTGTTLDNASNLSKDQVDLLFALYEGTTQGRQELLGELLDGLGSIVKTEWIHQHRRTLRPARFTRTVLAIDPATTAKKGSDSTGLVVVGKDDQRPFAHTYVLADRTQEMAHATTWGYEAIRAYDEFGCDAVIYEGNQGGTMVETTLMGAAVKYMQETGREVVPVFRSVWAKEGKRARAEPIGPLYETGRVHHVGTFPQLERELTTWMEGMASPDRMDALAYAVTHLVLADPSIGSLDAYL